MALTAFVVVACVAMIMSALGQRNPSDQRCCAKALAQSASVPCCLCQSNKLVSVDFIRKILT